jgi:hypothetical protein
MSAAEILKKITIKDVMGDKFDPKALVDQKGEQVDLCAIVGVANQVVVDRTNYGEFYLFEGAFEATRLEDKAVFKSPKCILPEPVGTMMGRELLAIVSPEQIKEETVGDAGATRTRKRGNVPAAQFGVILGCKPSKKGARGYEWTTKPVVQPTNVDTLADLRARVNEQLKALPAPAPAAEPVKDAEKPAEKAAEKEADKAPSGKGGGKK